MPGRKARRDCRVGHRKKNHINERVEKLQKSISKEGKKDKPDEAEPSNLTSAAAAFLADMKKEVVADVEQTRTKVAAVVEPSRSTHGSSSGSGSGGGKKQGGKPCAPC